MKSILVQYVGGEGSTDTRNRMVVFRTEVLARVRVN